MGTDDPANAATYRVFWTNAAGRIDRVAQAIDADSDESAVWEAQALSQGRAAEVWLGDRHVATLNGSRRADQPPHGRRPAGAP